LKSGKAISLTMVFNKYKHGKKAFKNLTEKEMQYGKKKLTCEQQSHT